MKTTKYVKLHNIAKSSTFLKHMISLRGLFVRKLYLPQWILNYEVEPRSISCNLQPCLSDISDAFSQLNFGVIIWCYVKSVWVTRQSNVRKLSSSVLVKHSRSLLSFKNPDLQICHENFRFCGLFHSGWAPSGKYLGNNYTETEWTSAKCKASAIHCQLYQLNITK